jgi:hypothetical protein
MTTRLAVLAAVLALGAAVGLDGCADDRAAIQIQAVCSPPEDCTFSGSCDMQFIGYPTIDVGTTTRLWLFLQVENQLPDNTDLDLGRLNTNDAHIDETKIEYDGAPLPPVEVGSNFNVPAGGTAVVSVDAIPAAVGGLLATYSTTEVVARIRFGGYYDDDTRFETGEFPITIRVCSGCVGAVCGGAPTCLPSSDGQLPIACQAAETEPAPVP